MFETTIKVINNQENVTYIIEEMIGGVVEVELAITFIEVSNPTADTR